MSRPRIAIATCTGYADLKADDGLLRGALAGRGVDAVSAVWDDGSVDWGDFDACLIRSTWDYHRSHDEFVAWARRVEAATRLWNPETVAWNSNKAYLRELAERGVRIVPTVWLSRDGEAGASEAPPESAKAADPDEVPAGVEAGADLDAVLAERGWEEAIVKPAVDLGAQNLSRVRAGDSDAQAALERVLERHDAMVQPFLPSLATEGELSLVYIDGRYSHTVRKRPAAGDFRVQSIWGGTVESAQPEPEHLDLAERALSHVDPPPVYARADLVTDPGGHPCLMELELIEPNLYLGTKPCSVELLADAVTARLS